MKKLKFFIATLVFLILILVCGQVNATAPAKIYNKYDLYDYITAYGGDGSATIDGDKVILNKSITASTDMYFPSASDKCSDIYLDLNGYSIYFDSSAGRGVWWNSSDHNITITGKADTDSDFIRSVNGNPFYTGVTKNVTIENIQLIADSSTEQAFEGYQKSTTNMKNVILKSNFGGALIQTGMTVNMENVTFNLGNPTCSYGVRIYGVSTLTMKNCNYKSSVGEGKVVWIDADANPTKVIIDGGTYEYTGSSSNYLIVNEKGTLEIKDGTFTNKEGTTLRTIDGTTTISGGTFDGREKTITTAGDTTLKIKGGLITARTQFAGKQGAAVGFSMSKTLDDIIEEGYFANDTQTRTESGFRLTGPELCVYAKPDSITFDKTEFTYNGQNQAPTAIVKDTEGKTLQYDTDYIVEYPTERKNAGEYKATVKFIDRYESMPSKELSYKINKADFDMSNVKFEDKKLTYNGKKQKINVSGLPEGVTVSYTNNKKKDVGEYTVTAQFTISDVNNYNAIPDKTAKLTIVPKGTTLSKLTAGSKRFKATWKKQKTQTTGYQIQYSTNSKFKSGNKKVTIKKNKTISTTVKKLKGKKKYYVRIRTYKTVNGKKIYSDWSKSKKVTTRK